MQKEIQAAGMRIEIPALGMQRGIQVAGMRRGIQAAGMRIRMEAADTVAQDKEEAAPVNAVHTGAGETNACFTYV